MANKNFEDQYADAVAAVDGQITYEEWVDRMHASGNHNIAPLLAQLRQRGEVTFQLEVNGNQKYHTVRPAGTEYAPRTNWEG